MLHAKTALASQYYVQAADQMAQAQKLGIALPESFAVDYATALNGQGKSADAKSVLDKYFKSYGTKGASYKSALALLVQMEDQGATKPSTSSAASKTTATSSTSETWGLTDQDLSIMTGPEILKKVHITERWPAILAAAQAGDVRSQYLIGSSYAYGIGVAKDPTQEVAWLTKSAHQGLVRAAVALGMDQIRGNGTPQDDISGWSLLLQGANLGNAVAEYNAATLTLVGLDAGGGMSHVYKFLDKPTAFNMLRRSAAAGLSVAQYSLGHSFMVGTDLNKKDLGQARFWLEKAAAQNLPTAIQDLATLPPAN